MAESKTPINGRGWSAYAIVAGLSLAIVYKIFPTSSLSQHTETSSASGCIHSFDFTIPMNAVEKQARDLAAHSWEYGTLAQSLLDLHNPSLSIFSPSAFPAYKVPSASDSRNASGLEYIKPFIRLDSETLIHDDFGVSDPAALGVYAVMLGQNEPRYLAAAMRQKDFLLSSAPRYANGAISHRKGVEEVWSDAVHMVPPFLAYYAVVSNDLDMIAVAVEQCRLYREALLRKETGLWMHIAGSEDMEDHGAWSTGNAWAAMGMTRVAATIKHWEPARTKYRSEFEILVGWIKAMIDSVRKVDDDETGLLRNYLDDDTWFGETSGTALLAAVVYRIASLDPDVLTADYLTWADEKRTAVMRRVDEHGFCKPAVQPLNHLLRDPLMTGSPEGQSFVLELGAAWRDHVCAGEP